MGLRIRRRRAGTGAAVRRLRDDAYRVHAALDDLRSSFHAAEPGIRALGRSLRGVRRSLDGTGGDLAELGRAVHRGARRRVD